MQTHQISLDTATVGSRLEASKATVEESVAAESLTESDRPGKGRSAPAITCLFDGKAATCVDPRDPQQCTPGASKKAAITITFDEYIAWQFNSSWYSKMKKAAQNTDADLVLLLPAHDAPDEGRLATKCSSPGANASACNTRTYRMNIPENELQEIRKYFTIVRTPWVLPPNLSTNIPREGGCCGAREFMKLNALSLEKYDAVVNLDTDFSIHGSLKPLFDCAASGRFLTARGTISGVNGGMFAVRPSTKLLNHIVADLSQSTADDKRGWNMLGLAPGASYGQAGLQGFLYYYLYQRRSFLVQPGQLDPCEWTGAVYCPALTCTVSPLRHKIRCAQ